MMNVHNSLMWITVLMSMIGFSISTHPDPQWYCTNVRKPRNGDVTCRRYQTDDFLWHGGKSRPGSKSKGPGSRSRDKDIYACEFSCNKGYKLDGPSVLECPFIVTDNPTCVPVQCDVLPRIDHGTLNCTNHFLYGSMCQYTCAPGFLISGASNILTCGAYGFWNNPVPKCQPVKCPALRSPIHGSISCPTGRSFGSDCRFSCDDRFQLDGSFLLSCTETGNWTDATPICKLGECRPLPFLVHGSLSCSSSSDVGSRCTYVCQRGYRLQGGSRVLFCGANGFWRGSIPTCWRGYHFGNSNEPVLYDDLPYEFTAEDGIIDEVAYDTPMQLKADSPSINDKGLNSSGIAAVLAVIVIVTTVVVGLFVAYRHRKNRSRHQPLRPDNTETSTLVTAQ